MKVVLLDAGHGGLDDNGNYLTPGKRSPKWADGSQYFEGVGNRLIRDEIKSMCEDYDIPYHLISTGAADVSLRNRVQVINAYCDAYGAKNCLLVSVHSNGADSPQAHGFEVFTSPGQTMSDVHASILANDISVLFPDATIRSDKTDGDVDKEAKFYLLTKSKCPAILSENFFHTNEYECKNILMNISARKKIALAHFNVIKMFMNIKEWE